jgi:orotate phosphoribosyltransferase
LEAVDALRLAGHSVHHMLALFSYGFDTADVRFQASKVQVKTMSGYADLIQVAEEENGLSVTDMEELRAWRKQPETWNQHA